MVLEDTFDCTDRCRCLQHGNVITAAISRRSVSDQDLCAFLHYTCASCENVRDSVGRTALHVAASCGRVDLVRWLVQHRHANINLKDEESGFSPLHRSIFYGKINVAVELIKLGANPNLFDSDGLTMLDHAVFDGFSPNASIPGELYVWGSNSNNSLGPHKSKSIPDLLDVFHRKFNNEFVSKVAVGKFHSVILGSSGKVYSCGHGLGGRLGLGQERSVVEPELVSIIDKNDECVICLDVAVSSNHSLFLSSKGNLYSCGLNTHRVLGITPSPEKLLVPTYVKHLSENVNKICAGQYHSVAWGPKCLYTWGFNGGQLGHVKCTDDGYVAKPKLVKVLQIDDTEIKTVDSSDGAISLYTKKGDIYVLHEYQCRKIASRQLNIVQVAVCGGNLNVKGEAKQELKVVALTNTGNLFLWQETDPQLCRCIFSLNRTINIRQVTLNINAILFVTDYGEAFQGYIKPRKKKTVNADKSAFHKFLEREDCVSVKLVKIVRIHRAIFITSDPKGNDFCIVQAQPYKNFQLSEIMKSEMKNNLTMLLNTCEEDDDICDVVFKLENKYFPAHRYILASKSSHFEKILQDNEKMVELKGYDPLIFEQFLKFVYTGECDLIKCGECPEEFRKLCEKQKDEVFEIEDIGEDEAAFEVYKNQKPKSQPKCRNPVRMLHEMAKKFRCGELCNILTNYDMQKFVIKIKSDRKVVSKALQFDHLALSDFNDVRIKCGDGKEVNAHKCMLAARSDYFNNLFSTRWHGNETTVVTIPFQKSIVLALLEYLYTDTLNFANNREQDHLFKLIILADQLFISRLKEQCEFHLFSSLNLKNCIQFLNFANRYNARKLKFCSMKFIVANTAPVLELQMFDDLDEELLKELSDFYFEEKKEICCRVITPYSIAPSEEEIVSIATAFPVSLTEEIVEKVAPKSAQKRRSRTHNKLDLYQNKTNKEQECGDESFIQFPDSPPSNIELQVNVPSRLRAIKLAEEKLEVEEETTDFTKLISKDFPLLSSPPNSSSYGRSPHKLESRHKIAKLSQKQRKRLSSETSIEATPESPKNPWKIVSEVGSPPVPETRMSDIIFSEKKQKENWEKIKSKPLLYTQKEDKAIEYLCKMYNIEEINEEIITVGRVVIGAIATPVWVPKKS